jgi:LytR cell envelope-related transcriptional attenuator
VELVPVKRTAVAAAGLVAIVVVASVVVARFGRSQAVETQPRPRVTSGVVAPTGARVRVQVLNGTTVRGLARRATMVLRDRGFDVVETGTVSGAHDTTVVRDLSGHPDWANRIARVLAPARVETRIDSSRYLDIAVILGSAWRPPSEPFYP